MPKCSIKILLLFIGSVLFLGIDPAAAQIPVLIQDETFEEDAKQAIDSLYNRNPDAARDLLSGWIEQYPEHPLWILWDGMELWWNILNDLHNTEYDEHFFNVMKRADYEAGQLLKQHPDHPDALIIRAIATGYTARHHSNREEWLTAANIGRRAYQAYSRLMEVVPNLPDNDFAEGMKSYYAAYIPESYAAVRAVSWFLPDGDKQHGLEMLKSASEKGVFARPESTYFLGNILLNYEKRYEEALSYFLSLTERYPANSYYKRLYIRTLSQLNRYRDVIVFSDQLEQDGELEQNPVLKEEIYYQKGIAHYRSGEVDEALEAFQTAHQTGINLPNSSKRPIYSLSAYYAGRSSERMNLPEQAADYYQRVVESDSSRETKSRARDRLKEIRG
ncbi:tetratricopeptide repeat protein [Rhodohalobacter halophilus]|uniref:tetratricopeptide repeat protein n=1 Tax=Rhodohalobacter halophilus TaxID=1812810 RepID=UPI00083F733B|nr:tetratricopeptide repeat protein [Rhodohalobacter halophilus]